jgi:hypothetical protein
MPRSNQLPASREAAPLAPSSLMASAVRLPGRVNRVYQRPNDWQAEAWRHYDICGELRYASNWMSNVLSRATLHAAVRSDNGVERALSGPAVVAVDDLFNGPEGQSQMLSALGMHLTVAGEGYLVGRKPVPERGENPVDGDVWEIVGTQEMKHRGKRWFIDYGDGERPLELDDDAVIIRIWRPHPRRRIEADSPVRALLPILREIEFLTRHIMAQVTSRLAGAGILQLPQGMTFPTAPADSNLPEGASNADVFMSVLGDAMTTPITNPDSPAALVPIVVTVPDELVGKIEHLKFWTELDNHAVELRTEAIRRLALGLDMPPEVLLGTATLNHWGSWQMEESSIKSHIEPLLELITNALTIGYLSPLLGGTGEIVAYDTTALRLRPNRSREAIELYDRGELDGKALRRETGFEEDDAPDADAFKQFMLRKVAGGSTTPEQVADALAALGILEIRATSDEQPTEGPPRTRSLDDHPDRDLPERDDDNLSASLYAAAEVLVFRALERAGNRLRSLKQVRPTCAAADTYMFVPSTPRDLDKLLEDAWTCLPRVMANVPDIQRRVITAGLDAYCRSLLLSQREHDRATMVRFMNSQTLRTLED